MVFIHWTKGVCTRTKLYYNQHCLCYFLSQSESYDSDSPLADSDLDSDLPVGDSTTTLLISWTPLTRRRLHCWAYCTWVPLLTPLILRSYCGVLKRHTYSMELCSSDSLLSSLIWLRRSFSVVTRKWSFLWSSYMWSSARFCIGTVIVRIVCCWHHENSTESWCAYLRLRRRLADLYQP